MTDQEGDGPMVWRCLNCGSKALSAVEPIGCTCGGQKGFEEVDVDGDQICR